MKTFGRMTFVKVAGIPGEYYYASKGYPFIPLCDNGVQEVVDLEGQDSFDVVFTDSPYPESFEIKAPSYCEECAQDEAHLSEVRRDGLPLEVLGLLAEKYMQGARYVHVEIDRKESK